MVGNLSPGAGTRERGVNAAVVLFAALSDGLVLHLMLDSELPSEAALGTLGELLGGEPGQKE